MNTPTRRQIWAWALYDWANSAFATTIMAGFFPTFFRQFWSAGVEATTTTWRLGLANGIAGFVIAACAPYLGVLADRSGSSKHFVMAFTLLGVCASGGLYFVAQGEWAVAVILFVVGTIGFNGGIVFYDSLLTSVAAPRDFDRVSALGYAMGYLGGGLLFTINVVMTLKPAWFGLASQAEAVQFSFLTVAAWWLVFSLPLAMRVTETGSAAASPSAAGRRGFFAAWKELASTVRSIASHRLLWMFLLAYWLYIDGVNTVIKMAVDYGLALGLPASSLLAALLLTQFVAFPASLLFGWLGLRWGARRSLLLCVAVYASLCVAAMFLTSVAGFYALAVVVGLVQGGVQSLSRAYFGRLVPAGKSAEYFGFYNMMGKFATVLGPVLVGATAALSGNSRYGIGSLVLLFMAGGWLLWRLPEPAGSAYTPQA